MRTHRSLLMPLVASACAGALALSACAPGQEAAEREETTADAVDTDISDNGEVTLTIWDQEVRGGQAKQIEALNEAFMQAYPNVTIDRTQRAIEDLERTVGNALTSEDPPDVVQVNNNRANMGEFVSAGLLQSLDGYAEAYGWDERFPESVRALASYSEDGAEFGAGSLYGLAQVGELVGVWYNKPKLDELGLEVPASTADFEAALAAAKQAGETPIAFGNVDGWPGIHDFGFVQNQFVARDDVRNLGFGRAGSAWTSDANRQAAETFSRWVEQGYFTEGFNGLGYDPAWQDFAKGDGVFLVAGTWLQGDLADAMGDDVGFFLPPVGESGERAVTGGTGIPWAVSNGTDDAAVAAAYIDFITSDDAMAMIQEAGNLPVVGGSTDAGSGAAADVLAAWQSAGDDDALVPYLDYATPDSYDLLTAQIQELGNASVSDAEFLDALEEEYAGATAGE